MTLDELRAALDAVPQSQWLRAAEAGVRAKPDAAASLFARADRALGRAPLPNAPGWTAGQAGRAVLLAALADADRIAEIYRHGDTAERLAVLKALPLLSVADHGVPLLHDALRANDPRLVAAALGPCGRHLDRATWRQGVVKCVFLGIPLAAVDGLAERADDELAAMLAGLAQERAAAGRTLPDEVNALLHRLTENTRRAP